MVSLSPLPATTQGFKQQRFKGVSRMQKGAVHKMRDDLATDFFKFH